MGKFFDDIGKAIKKFFEDIGIAISDFFNRIFGTGSEPIKPVKDWKKQEILDFYNEAVIKTDAQVTF